MSKLPPFLEDESLVPYTHLKSTKNLDFQPGQSTLTLSNIKVAEANSITLNPDSTSHPNHKPNPSPSPTPSRTSAFVNPACYLVITPTRTRAPSSRGRRSRSTT